MPPLRPKLLATALWGFLCLILALQAGAAEAASRFVIMPEANVLATANLAALRSTGFYRMLQDRHPEFQRTEAEWLALLDLQPAECLAVVLAARIPDSGPSRNMPMLLAVDSSKAIDIAAVLRKNQERGARRENKTLTSTALDNGTLWRLANADDPGDQMFLALSQDRKTLFISPGRLELENALARERSGQAAVPVPAVHNAWAARPNHIRFACALPDRYKQELRRNEPAAPTKGGDRPAHDPGGDPLFDLAKIFSRLENVGGDLVATADKASLRLSFGQPTAADADKGMKTLQTSTQFLAAMMAFSSKDPELPALAQALQRLSFTVNGTAIRIVGVVDADTCERLASLGRRLEEEQLRKARRREARGRNEVDLGP